MKHSVILKIKGANATKKTYDNITIQVPIQRKHAFELFLYKYIHVTSILLQGMSIKAGTRISYSTNQSIQAINIKYTHLGEKQIRHNIGRVGPVH